MIRPLRQRHRRIFTGLGLFLPAAFVVGIAARQPAPTVAALPEALAPAAPRFDAVVWERAGLFSNSPVRVRLLREQKDAGRFAVDFEDGKDLVKPDLIVYWVAGNPNQTGKLPDNAVLLGSFIPAVPLFLPADAFPGGGALALYSLADQEIAGMSKPFTLQPP